MLNDFLIVDLLLTVFPGASTVGVSSFCQSLIQ